MIEKQLAKEIRLLGLKRDEAAKILGVTETTLSHWINGKHPIRPVSVAKLREMGVPDVAIRNPAMEVME